MFSFYKHHTRIVMKIKKAFILVAALLIVGGVYMGEMRKKGDVVILNKKSYFNNYVIENNLVKIRCVVTIDNKSKKEKTVKVVADLKDEVNIGLLKQGELTGYFTKTESDSITIPPFSSLNYIDVEFTGEYGGVSKMKSRNLPKLHIIEVLKM